MGNMTGNGDGHASPVDCHHLKKNGNNAILFRHKKILAPINIEDHIFKKSASNLPGYSFYFEK